VTSAHTRVTSGAIPGGGSGSEARGPLAREVAAPAKPQVAADINAIAGRWDELVERARLTGKALLGAALASSTPHTITKGGELTIALDEPNDFHAKAIEQARAELLGMLGEWFEGLTDLRVHRGDSPGGAPERPTRMTAEMVKSERLTALRRKSPALDAAIDVLDLDLAD
jgi:hypothetical protein